MRWLLRLLLFWAISGPLFYLFGLPLLLDKLNTKTRHNTFDQCLNQLREQKLLGDKISPTRGDQYCHCVSDGLTFTHADIRDMVLQKPPVALTALSESLLAKCNAELSSALDAEAARAYEALDAQQPGAQPGTAAPKPLQDLTIIENPN